MIRLTGARISEAFGLRVSSLRRGHHGRWVLDIEEQGGQHFDILDDDGERRRVVRKDELKNRQSVRTVVIPQALAELLLTYIDVVHTDPVTGEVDTGAPLFPGDNSGGEASQAGFRSALERALGLAGIVRFTPRELRDALNTGLEQRSVGKVARQRYIGHLPGEEVIDEHYTFDLPDGALTLPVTDVLDAVLAEHDLDSLLVPTARLPLLRHADDVRQRVRLAADSLISLGWLMPPSDGDEVTLSASEVGVPRLHASCGPHRRPLPDAARTASVVACPRDSLRSADSRAP